MQAKSGVSFIVRSDIKFDSAKDLDGKYPPAEFTRPEVAAVLVEAYRPKVTVS